MSLGFFPCHRHGRTRTPFITLSAFAHISHPLTLLRVPFGRPIMAPLRCLGPRNSLYKPITVASLQPLDLTEDNVKEVLTDARAELAQIFDTSVGITGQVELAELDGPFVKIRLKGRFWHKRSTVLARVANYLRQRIPEILEVDIEDEKQLDDSPENF